jgi:periplasmic protein TonB
MTSNEILKADVLDIVFDNRNKEYGAYLLRKYYNNRLLIALGGMIGFVLIIVLVVNLSPGVKHAIQEAIKPEKSTVVVVDHIEPPPPTPVPPPVQPARQVRSSANIILADETTVRTQEEIDRSIISGVDVDGPDVNPELPSVAEPTPAAVMPVVENPPPPPPAPTTPASFPGGQQAWMKFLNKYLQTPGELQAGEKKSVVVRFVVDEEGSVSKFEITRSGGAAFDNEVIRVLKKMPKWKPAVQNGRSVAVMFSQPVSFMAFEE